MPMSKDQIAEVLVKIATLLELKGENPFKPRAYVNAARALETLEEPLDKLILEERLGAVRGIGDKVQLDRQRRRLWRRDDGGAIPVHGRVAVP